MPDYRRLAIQVRCDAIDVRLPMLDSRSRHLTTSTARATRAGSQSMPYFAELVDRQTHLDIAQVLVELDAIVSLNVL